MVKPGDARRRRRVIVCEDDAALRELIRHCLEPEGFEAVSAPTAAALRRLHEPGRTELILLDLMLPDESGLEVCRQLRALGDDTPVIMISGRQAEVDRIVGLEMGADDYLGKPFHPRELLARVQAVLRRRPPPAVPASPEPAGSVVRFGRYTLDLGSRQLRRGQEVVPLTSGEFAMLKALVRHPRQALSRERLAQLARGRPFLPFDRSLDVQVSRLRRLLEEDPAQPRYIQTVWGVGYVFVPDEPVAANA